MRPILLTPFAALALLATAAVSHDFPLVAAAPQADGPASLEPREKLTPDEKMRRRFPQPVRVGFLIGLPVLDWRDSTIGFIRHVVRTPEGRIQLIVPYSPWFGWVRYGGPFGWGRREVAVPIEAVAMLGKQVAALDMSREEFDAAPTFVGSNATLVSPDETIRVALTRR